MHRLPRWLALWAAGIRCAASSFLPSAHTIVDKHSGKSIVGVAPGLTTDDALVVVDVNDVGSSVTVSTHYTGYVVSDEQTFTLNTTQYMPLVVGTPEHGWYLGARSAAVASFFYYRSSGSTAWTSVTFNSADNLTLRSMDMDTDSGVTWVSMAKAGVSGSVQPQLAVVDNGIVTLLTGLENETATYDRISAVNTTVAYGVSTFCNNSRGNVHILDRSTGAQTAVTTSMLAETKLYTQNSQTRYQEIECVSTDELDHRAITTRSIGTGAKRTVIASRTSLYVKEEACGFARAVRYLYHPGLFCEGDFSVENPGPTHPYKRCYETVGLDHDGNLVYPTKYTGNITLNALNLTGATQCSDVSLGQADSLYVEYSKAVREVPMSGPLPAGRVFDISHGTTDLLSIVAKPTQDLSTAFLPWFSAVGMSSSSTVSTVSSTSPPVTTDSTASKTTPSTSPPVTTDSTVPETTPSTSPAVTTDSTAPQTTPSTSSPVTTDSTVPETTPSTSPPVTTHSTASETTPSKSTSTQHTSSIPMQSSTLVTTSPPQARKKSDTGAIIGGVTAGAVVIVVAALIYKYKRTAWESRGPLLL